MSRKHEVRFVRFDLADRLRAYGPLGRDDLDVERLKPKPQPLRCAAFVVTNMVRMLIRLCLRFHRDSDDYAEIPGSC